MELSFEECLKELEAIVRKLENKDIALDEAVKNYQKGLELSKRCYEIFNQTQEMGHLSVPDHSCGCVCVHGLRSAAHGARL